MSNTHTKLPSKKNKRLESLIKGSRAKLIQDLIKKGQGIPSVHFKTLVPEFFTGDKTK